MQNEQISGNGKIKKSVASGNVTLLFCAHIELLRGFH